MVNSSNFSSGFEELRSGLGQEMGRFSQLGLHLQAEGVIFSGFFQQGVVDALLVFLPQMPQLLHALLQRPVQVRHSVLRGQFLLKRGIQLRFQRHRFRFGFLPACRSKPNNISQRATIYYFLLCMIALSNQSIYNNPD